MSAAPAQVPVRAGEPRRRRAARYPIAIPVDVTVLRSGVPRNIPGRLLDLGESGAGAVLAGDVRPGELIGVEWRLPQGDEPIRAKAVVRHQDPRKSGLEFLRLSEDDADTLRQWALRMGERSNHAAASKPMHFDALVPVQSETTVDGVTVPTEIRRAKLRWVFLATAVALILAAVLGWWRWNQGWTELEARLPQNQTSEKQAPVRVAAGVMEGLITHRVEPAYPEEAQRQKMHGLVMLDAVIGRDGTVLELRPASGPDLLATAAMDSVKWWHYEPYRVDGQATEVATTILVNFPGK